MTTVQRLDRIRTILESLGSPDENGEQDFMSRILAEAAVEIAEIEVDIEEENLLGDGPEDEETQTIPPCNEWKD